MDQSEGRAESRTPPALTFLRFSSTIIRVPMSTGASTPRRTRESVRAPLLSRCDGWIRRLSRFGDTVIERSGASSSSEGVRSLAEPVAPEPAPNDVRSMTLRAMAAIFPPSECPGHVESGPDTDPSGPGGRSRGGCTRTSLAMSSCRCPWRSRRRSSGAGTSWSRRGRGSARASPTSSRRSSRRPRWARRSWSRPTPSASRNSSSSRTCRSCVPSCRASSRPCSSRAGRIT